MGDNEVISFLGIIANCCSCIFNDKSAIGDCEINSSFFLDGCHAIYY